MQRTFVLTVAIFIAAACGGPAVQDRVRAAPPVIVAEHNGLPADFEIPAALTAPLGVLTNGVGDHIALEVVRSIEAPDGTVLVPAGASVQGRITSIARPATAGNQIAVGVRFDRLSANDREYPIRASVDRVGSRKLGSGLLSGLTETTIPRGGLLDTEDALALAGIQFDDRDGAVISLGAGDEEPLLIAGTPLAIRLTDAVTLR